MDCLKLITKSLRQDLSTSAPGPDPTIHYYFFFLNSETKQMIILSFPAHRPPLFHQNRPQKRKINFHNKTKSLNSLSVQFPNLKKRSICGGGGWQELTNTRPLISTTYLKRTSPPPEPQLATPGPLQIMPPLRIPLSLLPIVTCTRLVPTAVCWF